MASTTDFGSVSPGSNPGISTKHLNKTSQQKVLIKIHLKYRLSSSAVLLSAVFAVFFAVSCRNNSVQKNSSALHQSLSEFPMVEAPAGIVNPEDRVNWYSEHFWDGFFKADRLDSFFNEPYGHGDTLADTTILGLSQKDFVDAFISYVLILKNAKDYNVAQRAMRKLMDRAEALACGDSASGYPGNASLLTGIMQLGEDALYSTSSPYMDDQLYLPILEGILDSKYLPDSIKISYRYAHRIASLNKIGTKANNIQYATAVGAPLRNLYDINAEYTLIYFNNPDCESCRNSLDAMRHNEILVNFIGRGRLKVLSIYPDNDLKMWEKERADFPSDWIYAYDPNGELNKNTIYILRSIPSCYLLDRDKNIILKDANVDRVINELYNRY